MATISFEEGVDGALDGHFAGSAIRRVVDAYRESDGLAEIDVSLSGNGVPLCVFSPSRERPGQLLAVFLNEGSVLVGTGMDRDGAFRSFLFDPAAGTESTTCEDGFRRTTGPWSEDAFLGCMKEALGRWTRFDCKAEIRRLVEIQRHAGVYPEITFPAVETKEVGHGDD